MIDQDDDVGGLLPDDGAAEVISLVDPKQSDAGASTVVGGDDERLTSDQRDDDDTNRPGETDEDKRARRRLEKQQKRQNRRDYQEQDALLIQTLSDRSNKLEAELARLKGSQIQREAREIEMSMAHHDRRRRNAYAHMKEAERNEEWGKVRHAEQAMNASNAEFERLDYLRRQPIQDPAATEELGPQAKSHAEVFLERNQWFNPAGGDQFSDFAKRIDEGVAADGFKPDSAAYWRQLEARLQASLPQHLFEQQGGDNKPRDERGRFAPNNAQQQTQLSRQQEQRGGPPVAGRSESAIRPGERPGEVTVPASVVRDMKEAGVWDDPVRRNRVIKQMQANLAKAQK